MKTLNPLTKSRQSISPHSRAIPVVHWNSFSLKSNYIDSISPLNRILAWRQWNSNVTGFLADSWKCLAQWFWDTFWALFEMVTCWYAPVENQIQKSWNLFSSHLSSKGLLNSLERRMGAVSTPHPTTDAIASCKATSMNKCLQPSLFSHLILLIYDGENT